MTMIQFSDSELTSATFEMTCVDLYGRTLHSFTEMNMPRRGNSYYFPKYKEQFAQRSILPQELCLQSMLLLKSTDA